MRTPIMAGNWKMNKTVVEALALVEALKPAVAGIENVEIVVGPTFTALAPVGEALRGSNIALAAQDMHWEESGAFTGEISGPMLKDVGCAYVIIGHSERRQYFAETNETANRKLHAAHAHGLSPIYCVGEKLEQREMGITKDLIAIQVKEGLVGLTKEQLHRTVIAYEPVWAIGTGRTASPEQAQAVHAHIRGVLADLYDAETADAVRIQYGGSVKPGNVDDLIAQPDIDGGLIGGASLVAESFAAIVSAASRIAGH